MKLENMVLAIAATRQTPSGAFAVGVVHYDVWRRVGRRMHRKTLLRNVHFSPAAFLDDLLRRPHRHREIDVPQTGAHAVVMWRRDGFQCAVDAAVSAEPGVYVHPLDAASVRAGLGGAVEHVQPLPSSVPLSWLTAFQASSTLLTPGTIAIGGGRDSVREALEDCTWSMRDALADIAGLDGDDPDPCTLADIAAPLSIAMPDEADTGAWALASAAGDEVGVLTEALHVAMYGENGRLLVNHLQGFGASHLRAEEEGATWRYQLPTDHWEAEIRDLARCDR